MQRCLKRIHHRKKCRGSRTDHVGIAQRVHSYAASIIIIVTPKVSRIRQGRARCIDLGDEGLATWSGLGIDCGEITVRSLSAARASAKASLDSRLGRKVERLRAA